jgi:hypothetical protein
MKAIACPVLILSRHEEITGRYLDEWNRLDLFSGGDTVQNGNEPSVVEAAPILLGFGISRLISRDCQ